jgi:hypothetical protein
VVEAMKMQNILRAPRKATIKKVHTRSTDSFSCADGWDLVCALSLDAVPSLTLCRCAYRQVSI